MHRITRQIIKNNPDVTFVYGTSLHEQDFRGQAEECLGEKNTIGFPVKKRTCRVEKSNNFFYDSEQLIYESLFNGTMELIKRKETVYILPKIGTGCSQLNIKAPGIYKWMLESFEKLTNVIAYEDVLH